MLPSWADDTVIRRRPALVDDGHNNKIPDWTNTADETITGCSVQPGSTDEVLGNRDATLTEWTVYAPTGVDITATDGVEYGGLLYQVNGTVKRWPSPTGSLAHSMFELRRWEG